MSGVVDSKDFHLNSWRKDLQWSKILRVIRKRLVKVRLDIFAEIAEKEFDYKKCHFEYGRWLKLGIPEELTNRVKVAGFLRCNTSDTGDDQIRWAECSALMKDGKTIIYYITGKNITVA